MLGTFCSFVVLWEWQIDLGERCVQESVKRVMDNCEEDLAFFNLRVDNTCLDRLETTISRECLLWGHRLQCC